MILSVFMGTPPDTYLAIAVGSNIFATCIAEALLFFLDYEAKG